MLDQRTTSRRWLVSILAAGLWIALLIPLTELAVQAQQSATDQPTADGAMEAGAFAEAPAPDAAANAEPVDNTANARMNVREGISFYSLVLKGGWFMIPIGIMSLIVVTIAIERMIALRSNRVLPEGLVEELGQLSGPHGTFDPRAAYRACQRFPSATANVVRAMLLKVGRPHSEVEHTVAEASEREAERLYANIRWLNLAAAVTPLIGLLGTVWGMIDAFHRTTQLTPGQNKADELATGIYIALVTTFGGLMVAIPAAIFAHFFEGRVQQLFHPIDELLFSLLPQIEQYEGRVRFSRQSGEGEPPKTGEYRPQTQSAPSERSNWSS